MYTVFIYKCMVLANHNHLLCKVLTSQVPSWVGMMRIPVHSVPQNQQRVNTPNL